VVGKSSSGGWGGRTRWKGTRSSEVSLNDGCGGLDRIFYNLVFFFKENSRLDMWTM
jgi:hypothetical protein